MARLLWWYILWLMRRPWMKRLQHRWLTHIVRERKRAKAREDVLRQNRFARKWGLKGLTVIMNFVLASLIFTLVYLISVNLYEAGVFEGPKK